MITLASKLALGAGLMVGVTMGHPMDSMAAKDLRTPCQLMAPGENNPDGTTRCAWPDSSDFRSENLSVVRPHWFNSSSITVRSKACILYYNATGGACGTTASTTGSGARSLDPSRSTWTGNTAHIKYVTVNPSTEGFKGIFAYLP